MALEGGLPPNATPATLARPAVVAGGWAPARPALTAREASRKRAATTAREPVKLAHLCRRPAVLVRILQLPTTATLAQEGFALIQAPWG